MKLAVLIFAMVGITLSAQAKSAFCAGFEEGYKMIKGDNVYVPYCPYEPYTPYGSTPFREGVKAGMAAAQK